MVGRKLDTTCKWSCRYFKQTSYLAQSATKQIEIIKYMY